MSSTRSPVAAVSLAATAVIVVVMAIWGVNAFTAPIEDDDGGTTSATDDGTVVCGAGQEATIVEYLKRSEVVVSVYNAGKKAGRARTTLDLLESSGFRAGEIGNAPEGSEVPRAEVHAKSSDALAAGLVAQALGKNAQVVVTEASDLGPGVNVLIGDKFKKLDPAVPKRVKLPEARQVCR